MYDDYDIDYTFINDYNLDEDAYYEHHTRDADMDEDYARDGHDYESLAYRHYAWYNVNNRTRIMPTAQKRLVRVTLDLMCYDDLDLDDINWRELLDLEPNEDLHVNIKEYDPFE